LALLRAPHRARNFILPLLVSATYSASKMSVEKATFGAGCFWGTDKYFRKQFQLESCYTGYMGGTTKNVNYQQVCTGETGHAEVIQVEFKPDKVKYADMVEFFYRMHDPTTLNRQGNDAGTQYRSAIFFHSPDQERIAKEVTKKIQEARFADKKITTVISPAGEFYKAEDYHQEYLIKNPGGYCNHKLRW